MSKSNFQVGDRVVYCKGKFSTHPGPRAENVHAADQGDTYSYTVDKFWTIVDVGEDGTVVALTRTGKRHTLPATDPNLRHASWWTRFWHGERFPALPDSVEPSEMN